jgi:hypothetical protein
MVVPSEHHRFNLQKDSQRNSDYPQLDNPCQQLFTSSQSLRAKGARGFIIVAHQSHFLLS